jgi:hypothetical protein
MSLAFSPYFLMYHKVHYKLHFILCKTLDSSKKVQRLRITCMVCNNSQRKAELWLWFKLILIWRWEEKTSFKLTIHELINVFLSTSPSFPYSLGQGLQGLLFSLRATLTKHIFKDMAPKLIAVVFSLNQGLLSWEGCEQFWYSVAENINLNGDPIIYCSNLDPFENKR